MRIIGFSHYNLRAPRELLDTLREFYIEVVGLELGNRPPFASFGYRAEFERTLAKRRVEYGIAHVPEVGQVQLFFKDPAGNGVELNFAHEDA